LIKKASNALRRQARALAADMTQDLVTVAQLFQFDEIVDVRSPGEFALDHVPGAISCPVLDDAERARIGTVYVQESPFKARKLGAAAVARNIARHVEQSFADKPKDWRPLVYCWRGGQRSNAMTIVLRQIGWDAKRLAGGYRAYRRHAVAELERLAPVFEFRVVCGLTGSGKSALLRALHEAGAQVLDLERLAAHRGSVLGELPGDPQPTQKMFESRLYRELARFRREQPVFVEAESKKIGNLRVPECLVQRMWDSECVTLETALPVRVALLLRDYRHFTADRAELERKLDCLAPLHGSATIAAWKAHAAAGRWGELVESALAMHYDPAYRRSTVAHYRRLGTAMRLKVDSPEAESFRRLAASLLRPKSGARAA
jgi:tRNA 2-selenouridine synthase